MNALNIVAGLVIVFSFLVNASEYEFNYRRCGDTASRVESGQRMVAAVDQSEGQPDGKYRYTVLDESNNSKWIIYAETGQRVLDRTATYLLGVNKITLQPDRIGQGICGWLSLKSQGVRLITNPHSAEVLRLRFVSFLQRNLNILPGSQTKALFKGLLLGDESGFSSETTDTMKTLGLLHVIAVSGGNFSLVAGIVLLAFSWLPIKLKLIVTLFVLSIYIYLLTPDNLPALRAYLFSLVFIGSRLGGVKITTLGKYLLSAAAICLLDRYAIFGASMQLSFAASGIITFLTNLPHFLKNLLPKFISQEVLANSFSSVLVLPLSLHYFGSVNLVSVIWNTFFLPLFGLLNALAVYLSLAGEQIKSFLVAELAILIPLDGLTSLFLRLLEFCRQLQINVELNSAAGHFVLVIWLTVVLALSIRQIDFNIIKARHKYVV